MYILPALGWSRATRPTGRSSVEGDDSPHITHSYEVAWISGTVPSTSILISRASITKEKAVLD